LPASFAYRVKAKMPEIIKKRTSGFSRFTKFEDQKEKHTMKKLICTVFTFAVFAASAMASQGSEVVVKVPFAFQAGT
jgi:hypothetical protein